MQFYPRNYGIATVLGALLGALILGVGGRSLMRLIAVVAGITTGFSWGGSWEVVLLGVITGALAGLFYPLYKEILPIPSWAGGLLYGAIIFGIFLLLPIGGKGAARGFPELLWLTYTGFGFLFLVFGLTLAICYRRLIKY